MSLEFDYFLEIKNFIVESKIPEHFLVDDLKIEKLVSFVSFLKEENQKKNLISRKATDEDILKHIKSSLIFLKYLTKKGENLKLLDIGSGSGFPGIVLAICLPEISFSLMDSTQKKVDFLYDSAAVLGLINVECFWGRIEDFAGAGSLQENFDFVTAMALGSIEETMLYALPFLKIAASFITIKSLAQEVEFLKAEKYLEKFSLSFSVNKEESVSSFILEISKNQAFLIKNKKA